MAVTDTNTWITCPQPNPRADLRLFCFPYAGGGAKIFQKWADGLPRKVEVRAVRLPGRDSRLREPALSSMPELVEPISRAMRPYVDQPFAIFGHSMGAKLCFEVALDLRKQFGVEPAHLIVSGSRAPHLRSDDTPMHQLTEPEFIEKLRSLNGTPREVLEHADMMSLLLPTLRADFQVIETYLPDPLAPPLNCPLTVYGGLQDPEVQRADLEAWGIYTTASFTVRMLPGDHFFLHTAEYLLLHTLSRDLQQMSLR
ncbi:MAG TPA: alpha/beta fold hydrolase [Pyrinomonadaceae bacterium]